MFSKILGTGSYVPATVRTNADLERMVETSDEWIVERTGIKERRIAGEDETVVTWPKRRLFKRYRPLA